MNNSTLPLLKNYMRKEHQAIGELLTAPFPGMEMLIDIILGAKGRVVFVGIGKSGHIGKKLAATFASTGTPAIFVHGTEALHGDLGMIHRDDIAILLSNSGETQEMLALLPSLKKMAVRRVAFTGNRHSSLAMACDLAIEIRVETEADDLGLAPSSSSTAVLVVGDALALTLSHLKQFTRQNFGLYHPGGTLGKRAV
ncbi:SIS domain-containing protein [Enterobacter sp. ENT03]|uniref:KpsF/GutQ family sugar-phosphate isomerase n=1 Tax=Enterobacter sp. ENT03 TaxID=2854780 RepID=UPI001C466C78|nr:SIS domain-containing protein [Enterobacter sp. ENT03]MBV7407124.1 SIS domain-containing protein [Enterobacter sp. ENT03]